MKKVLQMILLVIVSKAGWAQQSVNPIIKDHGSVYAEVPGKSIVPDSATVFKVVIEINKSDTASKEVNPSLDLVARYLNLLAVDGVAPARQQIVLLFHNAGSYILQTDQAFARKYGYANPNTALLTALAGAGVQMMVCGQSTVKRKLLPSELHQSVRIGSSFLTIHTWLQLKGFATLSF